MFSCIFQNIESPFGKESMEQPECYVTSLKLPAWLATCLPAVVTFGMPKVSFQDSGPLLGSWIVLPWGHDGTFIFEIFLSAALSTE